MLCSRHVFAEGGFALDGGFPANPGVGASAPAAGQGRAELEAGGGGGVAGPTGGGVVLGGERWGPVCGGCVSVRVGEYMIGNDRV